MSFESNLEELKRRIQAADVGCVFTETCYRRFLNGRKNVLEDAVDAMLSFAAWRKENNVDSITVDDCSSILAKKIAIPNGRDKHGRPLVTVLTGRHDKNNRDIRDMKNCIIYFMEDSLRLSNPEEETFCIVFDMASFSMRCMDFESVRLLVDILQFNYPDTLGQAIVVNAPFIFSACWSVIKVWLDPVTAAKVNFIKTGQLKDYVDEEFILPEVGDKTICPL